VRGGRHPPVGLFGARERVEREHLHRRVAVAAGRVEQRLQPRAGAGVAVARVERGQQALAQRRLLAAARVAMPGAGRRERAARRRDPAQRPEHAPEVHAGEHGEPHVAGRLRLLDRELERGRAGLVVAGLALRAAEARELVRLRLLEAEPARGPGGSPDVEDRVVEVMLDPSQLAEHRVAPDVEPRVVDLAQPALDLVAGGRGALAIAGRDRRAGGEESGCRLVPRVLQPAGAAGGELQRVRPLAVVRDHVSEVVVAARPQIGVVGQPGSDPDVLARELEVAGGRLDPGREQVGARPLARGRPLACGLEPGQQPLRGASSGSLAALQASAASRFGRSRRANARYSAWRLLRTPAVETPAAAPYHAACAARASRVAPASAIDSSAKARMLSSSR